MAEVLEVNTGICSTCNYLVDCPQRLRTENPIWFCENYDDSDGRASANNPGINITIPDEGTHRGNSSPPSAMTAGCHIRRAECGIARNFVSAGEVQTNYSNTWRADFQFALWRYDPVGARRAESPPSK